MRIEKAKDFTFRGLWTNFDILEKVGEICPQVAEGKRFALSVPSSYKRSLILLILPLAILLIMFFI